MRLYPSTINRDGPEYQKAHYRAHWQPLWAYLGLVLCGLLVLTQGWAAIYDLCVRSPGVSREDSIVDLVAAYLGVCGYPVNQQSNLHIEPDKLTFTTASHFPDFVLCLQNHIRDKDKILSLFQRQMVSRRCARRVRHSCLRLGGDGWAQRFFELD